MCASHVKIQLIGNLEFQMCLSASTKSCNRTEQSSSDFKFQTDKPLTMTSYSEKQHTVRALHMSPMNFGDSIHNCTRITLRAGRLSWGLSHLTATSSSMSIPDTYYFTTDNYIHNAGDKIYY